MNIWYLVLAVLMILPVPALVKNNRVPTNLGYEDGRLAELPASPNAVSSQTSDPERYVEPLPYLGNREESRQRIISAARLYGNARIVREEDGYLHIVFPPRLCDSRTMPSSFSMTGTGLSTFAANPAWAIRIWDSIASDMKSCAVYT
jgi:hypothetical protein